MKDMTPQERRLAEEVARVFADKLEQILDETFQPAQENVDIGEALQLSVPLVTYALEQAYDEKERKVMPIAMAYAVAEAIVYALREVRRGTGTTEP